MLTNFLDKSKPINFIVYLSFFYCFFFIAFFSNVVTDSFSWNIVLKCISFFCFFLFIFFFYNFILSKNKLTFDHSYAFFLFVLTLILFVSKLILFKALIVLLLYLLFLRKTYSLRSSKKVIQKIFDGGFWLGIMCILEPFSFLFIVLIYASIFLHQKITIHTLLTPIMGFITSLIVYFAYLFWYDSVEIFTQLFYLNLEKKMFFSFNNKTNWVFISLLLITLLSILLKSPKALSVNNSFKKSWLLLIINTIIAIVFAVFVLDKKGYEIVFFLIP